MMRNSTMKWVAPIVLAGVVIAGGSAAIAAAPWSNDSQGKVTEVSYWSKPSKAGIEARKAEMQERLANRVESGEITQTEADDIRAKMADRKAKIQRGERPAKADMGPRKAEMQERLANRVESGEITQAEADDIRAKMADRKATGRLGIKR
jgi:Arc/MetJ-type ribon-helix-helix transcriptional regulator